MADHTFDPAAFRLAFLQFEDVTLYPDATLSAWWSMAGVAVSTADNCVLSGDTLQTILNLMTAHMGTMIARMAAGGGGVGFQSGATIDKVTVSYSPPPYKNGWQAWLSSTPYGLQIWALLEILSSGGFYIGGMPETHAFRKVYGVF